MSGVEAPTCNGAAFDGDGRGRCLVGEPGDAATAVGAGAAHRWTVIQDAGPATELLERSAALLGVVHDVALGHTVRLLRPQARAIVLGSTQASSLVDAQACRRSGTEVARRRSGGGAVLVEPDGQIWVDVAIPRSSPLWIDDVSRASWWLGEVWARALDAVGATGAHVWRGPMRDTPWSKLCCFAGIGPGEVLSPAGRKWVGISQRRNRQGAVLQSACLLRWDPVGLVDCLAIGPDDKRSAAADLVAAAEAVPAVGNVLAGAFLAHLADLV